MSPVPSISSMPSTPNSANGSHHHQQQHSKEVMPVQVALRVRPLNSRDRAQPRFSQTAESDVIRTFENTITIVPHQKTYSFDHVFDTKSTQEQIFETVGSRLVDRFLDGFNVTILAYGQTSSGKTYTMGTEVDDRIEPEHEGIIPRAMSALFRRLQQQQQQQTHVSSPLQNGERPLSTMMLSPPPSSSSLGLQQQQQQQRISRKGSSSTLSNSSGSSRLRPVSMIQPPSSATNNNNFDGSTARRGSAPTTMHQSKTSRYTVKVSFVEIYNEELVDLLNPAPPSERPPVTVREDTKGQIYWTGIKEVQVESSEDVLRYLQMGTRNRATGSTDMNAKSSRSHAIFSVTLRQEKWIPSNNTSSSPSSSLSSIKPTASTTTMPVNGSKSRGTSPTPASSRSSMIAQPLNRRASSLNVRAMVGQMERKAQQSSSGDDEDGKWVVSNSKFHFVDLAGSERLKRTAAEGDRRKEGININAGLLALGNVISALAEPSKRSAHIPYRDSKLTRLLQDSLGGNATTLMIACVSPAEINLVETANTIKYAHRARNIKNKVERNEAEEWMTNDNPDYLRGIINKLKAEIQSLKTNNSNNNSNNNCLSPPPPAAAVPNGKNFSHYVPTVSPSSSTSHTERLQISTCASSSAKTTITVPDTNDVLENQALVADLRRQIEELQNEVTVTRERNQHVEAELRKKSSSNAAHLDIDFQHLVEPVIEEYEKSLSALESQLAMARAALSHSDQALAEQEAKILEHETQRSIEQGAITELKARLAKAMEREQHSEGYIAELEAKLEKSVQEAMHDQQVLNELKSKITKFKEMDENTEQYIADLESRLFASETERDKLVKVAEQAQEQLLEQGRQLESIKRRLSFNHQADDTLKLLLKDLEISQSRCQELEQELGRLRMNLAEQQQQQQQQQDAASATGAPPLSPMFIKKPETCLSLQDEIGDKVEAELRSQLQAKTDMIKALEDRLTSIETDSRKEIESLQSELQAKASQMAALEKNLADIETMRMEFKGLRDKQSQEIERLEQQLESAKNDYALCHADLLEQQRQNAELSNSINDLQTKLTSATTDKNALESRLQSAQAQADNMRKSLQEQEQGFQSKVQAGLQSLEQAHADIRALVAIQDHQQRIIQCFEAKVASMDQLVVDLQGQLAERDQRITELETEKARKWQQLQKDMHDIKAGKKELGELVQFLEGALQIQDAKSNELLCALEALKAVCEKQQQQKPSSDDIHDAQTRLRALEEQLRQSKLEADTKLAHKKAEIEELQRNAEAQTQKIANLEKTLEVERQLASQNDTSGVVADLQSQLKRMVEQQKDYEAQLERAKADIEEAHRAKMEQQHVIESLESSLQAMQAKLEEAVASHAQKSLQIQSLQDQLTSRRRLTIETNVNRDSGLPDEDRRWSDLVNRIAQLEKENQLLTSSQSCQDSTEDLERLCATPTEELDPVEELQEQYRKKLSDPAGQEELLRKLVEYANEKSQLTAHVEKLEARLVLQRSQLTLENKNLELEILKLTAANERLEKEVEQALPRSTSMMNAAHIHNSNRDSVSFSSPPQTPRVSAPPAPTGASTSLPYKLQREWSSSSFSKLHKSGSLRSFLDKAEERAARRASGSSIRSSYTFSPARSRAQSTSCQPASSSSSPPPTAPPSNPLPPVPTASTSTSSSTVTIASPPQSPSRSVSTPMLQRQSSATATTISDMLSSKGSFTSEQYEKIIRSLQRKAQVADNDVRAHQEVITKLEAQLSRSENAVRDVKRQLDTLNREKQTYILEIQNLRSQINQVQSGQRLSMEQEIQEREKLLKELEHERQLKDKAEKARRIMENRMEELMNKRNKFMCF